MNYQDIIIEVKTKWIENNGNFYRDVIEYEIDCNSNISEYEAIKYINEKTQKRENKKNITNNSIEVNLLDKKRNILEINNDALKFLLEFAKYQWEV